MAQFIIEMGSGNTCRNDRAEVEKMIDAVAGVDSGEHEVILKWQLFVHAPPNEMLYSGVFDHAYHYAKMYGYETTASVFDELSLKFLLLYDVPFVKIACRPHLYSLIRKCPAPVYVSVSRPDILDDEPGVTRLCCVPEYPASLEDYERIFPNLRHVSDHTVGWQLYRRARPEIIEKHFVHERRAVNPDAGPFSVLPHELGEVL